MRFDLHHGAKYHPTPLSGGDCKALAKELTKARAVTGILEAADVTRPRPPRATDY